MKLVTFLFGCLIIRLVCYLFSVLCVLLCGRLSADDVVGAFLVISLFLLLVGKKWSIPNLPNLSVDLFNISSVYSVFLLVYVLCIYLFTNNY